MLGKVAVIAGAAYLLRSRGGQEQVARVLDRVRARQGARPVATPVADRRPQAALEHHPAPPVLLPDATPIEVARAVLAEHPRP